MKRLVIILWLAAVAAAWGAPARFMALDVVAELDGEPLAAYQIELKAAPGTAIVGLEGAGTGAFAKAPWYDPAGIGSDHIVIAAFSTEAKGLPRNRALLARIHVQVMSGEPDVSARLVTAAGPDGEKLSFVVKLKPVTKESADE